MSPQILYIYHRPVLQVVDQATHFAVLIFLRKVSPKKVWKAFLRCWIHVCLSPPDYLKIAQGSNFASKEFEGLAEATGTQVLECPFESPATISHVERYQAPLRAAYKNGTQAEWEIQGRFVANGTTLQAQKDSVRLCLCSALCLNLRNTLLHRNKMLVLKLLTTP